MVPWSTTLALSPRQPVRSTRPVVAYKGGAGRPCGARNQQLTVWPLLLGLIASAVWAVEGKAMGMRDNLLARRPHSLRETLADSPGSSYMLAKQAEWSQVLPAASRRGTLATCEQEPEAFSESPLRAGAGVPVASGMSLDESWSRAQGVSHARRGLLISGSAVLRPQPKSRRVLVYSSETLICSPSSTYRAGQRSSYE
jgi:hypothetical protein